MVCDCCKRRKKLFESYAAVQYDKKQLNFCVACNDLAYKVRDAANEHNKAEYDDLLNQWNMKSKKSTLLFKKWKSDFIKPLNDKFKSEKDEEKENDK